MSRICLLHIGTTKTGTTTIQHSLDINRKILNAAGYKMLSNKLRQGNSDYLLALSQSKNISDKNIEDLYRKFISRTKSNVIITSEQFSSLGSFNKDFFKKTFDFLSSCDLEIYVILYVRNQKYWILSDYIQDIKGGGTYSLDKYIKISLEKESYKYDLHKLLCSLRTTSINLIIRPYLKDFRKWNVKNDFYKSIPNFQPNMQKLLKNKKDQNTLRPTKSAIDQIILFNSYRSNIDKKIRISSDLKNSFKKVVQALSEMYKLEDNLKLCSDLEKQIESIYRDGNNEICKHYNELKEVLLD